MVYLKNNKGIKENKKVIEGIILVGGICTLLLSTVAFYSYYRESTKKDIPKVEIREIFIVNALEQLKEHKREKEIEEYYKEYKEKKLYRDIENIIKKYSVNTNISISYYEFYSGLYIGHNDEQNYVAASVTKVPLAMLICERLESGQLNLNTTMTYLEVDFEEGAGIMFEDNFGQAYTVETLLHNMIVYSDNVAKNMLYRYYGYYNSRIAMADMINSEMSITENDISAKEMTKFLKLLYEKKDDPYYGYIVELLTQTIFHERLDKYLPYEIVGHKVGDYFENTHDAAIIFSERPYILTVLTKYTEDADEIMSNLSKEIYDTYINSGVL